MEVVKVYLKDIVKFKTEHKMRDGLGLSGYMKGYIVESDQNCSGEVYYGAEYVDRLENLESPLFCYYQDVGHRELIANLEKDISIDKVFIEKMVDVEFDYFDFGEGEFNLKEKGELDSNEKAYYENLKGDLR